MKKLASRQEEGHPTRRHLLAATLGLWGGAPAPDRCFTAADWAALWAADFSPQRYSAAVAAGDAGRINDAIRAGHSMADARRMIEAVGVVSLAAEEFERLAFAYANDVTTRGRNDGGR